MKPETASLIIAIAGFIVSIGGSLFIAGFRWGQVKAELQVLKDQQSKMATTEQLTSVKESVAEIKGMFRLVPKDGSSL